MAGILTAFWIIFIPAIYPSERLGSLANLSSPFEAYKRAVPPPGTIPSAMAALVAQRASLTLSLTSPTSTSLAPPTLMTPTPPFNLANLSSSFYLS